MENKFLLDMSIKYGLSSEQVSKLADIIYQCEIEDLNSREAQKIGRFLCEMNLLDKPAEEIMEELKLKGFI